MSIQMNQSLSVDCAVFGFNGKSLKVLLIERRYYAPDTRLDKLKLPGAMILDNETLPQAAYRVPKRPPDCGTYTSNRWIYSPIPTG